MLVRHLEKKDRHSCEGHPENLVGSRHLVFKRWVVHNQTHLMMNVLLSSVLCFKVEVTLLQL
jgi:hypothetical protein